MVEMADAAAPYRIKGETGDWEVVVGLEVHAQITATKSKLFSGAATEFGAEPNTQVSLVDAAMPGMDLFNWRAIFYIAVPPSAAALLLGSVFMNRSVIVRH